MRRQILRGIMKNREYVRGRVLDFGCGEKPYRDLFNVPEYVGLDFEKTGHDNSQNEVDLYWDGKTIPLADDSFDSVISTEVFEHLFDIDASLSEIRRVLKADGNLLLTVPFSIHEHEIPYDFARYTHFGLVSILERNGFEIVSAERYGGYFEVIMQYHIWFTGKITETPYAWLTTILRLVIAAPTLILCNFLALVGPKNQGGMYLTNSIVAKKA